MVPNDAKWYRMVLNVIEWCGIMPNDAEWCGMVPNDTEWYQMVLLFVFVHLHSNYHIGSQIVDFPLLFMCSIEICLWEKNRTKQSVNSPTFDFFASDSY